MWTLISISTFLYASLTAELSRSIKTLEMRCYRRLLNISYKDHVTKEVPNRIQNSTGVDDDLLTMVKKRKLRWYGHISRSSGMERNFCRGRQEGEKDRRRDGKITSRNGQTWRLEIPLGGRKTGKSGKVLLQRHPWCTDGRQS